MQTRYFFAACVVVLTATSALAGKVHNKDSKAHDLTIKCGSTSTGSIQPNTVRDLGSGTCTVTVKKTGASATVGPKDMFVIRDSKLSK